MSTRRAHRPPSHRPPGKIPPSAIILAIVTFSLIAAIMLWGDSLPFLRWLEYVRPRPQSSTPPPTERISRIKGVVAPGQTFASLMSGFQAPPDVMKDMVRKAAPHVDLAALRPGAAYQVTRGHMGDLLAFELDVDAEHILKLTRKDGQFSAEMTVVESQVTLVPFSAVIAGNATVSGTLRDALLAAGRQAELAGAFVEIFAGNIDFTVEARAGDKVSLVYEQKTRDGRLVGIGRILAAEYAGQAKAITAVYFEGLSSKGDYYTPEGASLRKLFLKSPLGGRYTRTIPARHTQQPVAGKPALPGDGVSFTAPVGAPVLAVADGKVVYAGKRKGVGNLLVIRHASGYTSYYGRLSGFGPRGRQGSKAAQGDLVGYVGTVGRGTASYLDFRVQMGKRAVDPLKLFNAPAGRISKADSARFAALAKERLDIMRRDVKSSGK